MTRRPTALIGIGNEFRSDDGVGPAVIEAIRRGGLREEWLTISIAEPTDLLDAWCGAALAVLVDAAVCAPPVPGRVHRMELGRDSTGWLTVGGSTHGIGIVEAVRLAQVLDRAPDRVVVLTVEAECLDVGRGLSRPVAQAIPTVAVMVLAELGLSC